MKKLDFCFRCNRYVIPDIETHLEAHIDADKKGFILK